MRGGTAMLAGVLVAAAVAICLGCREPDDAGRSPDPTGREREHPDWSAPEDEGEAARPPAAIDRNGVERADGVWLFPVNVSAAAELPPDAARIAAAEIEVARLGDDIAFAERDPEGLRVKSTLERILLHADGLPARQRASLERYLLGFYVHHGSTPEGGCGARTNAAGLLRPDFIPGELAAAAEIAAQKGATFDLPKNPDILGANKLQELEALMAAVRPLVFGRFVGRAGAGPADAGAAAPAGREPETGGEKGGRSARMTALVEELRALAAARGLAPPLARTPDPQLVSSEEATLCAVGFSAQRDGGAFRALVGLPDPEGQAVLDAAFAKAQALDRIVRAVGGAKSVTEGAAPRARVRAVTALYASGALGPLFRDGSMWRVIEGPSVRVGAKGGEELWLLTNAAASFDAGFGASLTRAFSRDEAAARLRVERRPATRLAFHALREAAGRGTDGTETRSAEWLADHLGKHAALMAAMRADLAALYLALDPVALEARVVDGEDGARAIYEEYVGWTFESYGFGVPPPDLADEADARRAVLRNLAASGAVAVRGGDGTPVVWEIPDVGAARAAVASLLAEVRRIRFVGDAKAAAVLADSFLAAEAKWRGDIEARTRSLDRPRCAGFSFPALLPRTGGPGEVGRLIPRTGQGYVSGRLAAIAGARPRK